MSINRRRQIWWFALGYFLSYVPYSALTKAITDGHNSPVSEPLTGLALLPITTIVSVLVMFAFVSAAGLWRFASRGRRGFPRPSKSTFLSGLCAAAIIATTTLAYTFDGVSIVFVMLLMRGGVLLVAPIVDRWSRRRVRWFSWVAFGLSIASLGVALGARGAAGSAYAIDVLCALDVLVYLAAYFCRFQIMSRRAKNTDTNNTQRYLVEELIVAGPALLVLLAIVAVASGNFAFGSELRRGFLELWDSPILPGLVAIGFFSQAAGIFGSLVFLDARENTYCVAMNRASSLLAGLAASFGLAWLFGNPDSARGVLTRAFPSSYELIGAALIIVAIVVLGVGDSRRRVDRPLAPQRRMADVFET